ncbi:ribonuclease R [Thiohalobacter sp. IOR34]|uniref:ribonuclease R n=1 Tax=Thiohalobacter sp. IOR34 TaxID=3057176 RepID=UPI0025B24814|nr:ribonuclease R [Thiohalobacter sp. IOR34]WJW74795.1 ribonuclease R [Thiohalobacter sp. IOR34]
MARKRKKKSADWQQADPNAEREAQKYGRPIPSREFIMELLEKQGVPLQQEQIAELLGLDREEDLEALRRRLSAMVRDGQLVRNRRDGYGLVDKLDLVRGRVIAHPDGFGFLVPDEGGDDLFLSAREMRGLFHGDRVVARIIGKDRRGRSQGAVVEVLERNTHRVVGRFYTENGVSFVVPDSKRMPLEISIPPGEEGGAQHGQIVSVDILEQPTRRSPPIGRVIEVLGDHMAPGMEIDVAIRAHELPLAWPLAVEEEIAGLGDKVPPAAKRGRVDLRELPLVTIDGADSRDFDDAVYCERKPKGWRLLVAIADVSHYVRPGTALDVEAEARGNSVYFPERVIPMLPEVLSNGLCSLNPHVDRLCMVCEMYITQEGRILRSRFMEGVMRSHARLTYDEVAAMVVDRNPEVRSRYQALVPHLEELHRLYKVLRKGREARGAIDFDRTETRIEFGKARKIERIVPVERNDAHKLIEECMIAANVATARFLERHRLPTLYRVHEGPQAEKLADLREFLGELGLSLPGGDKPEARHFAQLLKQVEGRPDAHLIQTVMLRTLSQARYTPENEGHFGLALPQYLHFTSPIRRYPDLLVHRGIRHLLRNQQRKRKLAFPYGCSEMQSLGEHCSMTERRADEATRDAIDWLKCEYMLDKVGEEFDGVISSVTSFGLFVELADIYVEGLVHVTSLKNDYYHFNPAGHRLMGERTHVVYRLGDPIRVKVVRVDLDERKIDFELAGEGAAMPAAEPRRGGRKRGRRKKGRRAAAETQPAAEPVAEAPAAAAEPAKGEGEGKSRKSRSSRRRRSRRKKS